MSARKSKPKYDFTDAGVQEQLQRAIDEGRKLIFVDEVAFTRTSCLKLEWSRKRENITVVLRGSTGNYMTAIAGISYARGIELYAMQHDSVDQEDFRDYLATLIRSNAGKKLAVFLDNLAVHHTDLVTDFCKEKDVRLIFNVTYSPDFNPIEQVFSVVKNHYKRVQANYEVNEIAYD